MRSIVAASVVGAVVADYKCPGSPAFLTHAGLRMTSSAPVSCDVVKSEMKSRIAGENGWYDQHNRGTYTEQNYGGDLSASRLTGDGKYTDKMIFVLTPTGTGCKIEGCSEAQVTSVADFGTNYCEQKLLYCGSDEGCNVAHSDFANSEDETRTMAGAGTGMGNCLKVKEEKVKAQERLRLGAEESHRAQALGHMVGGVAGSNVTDELCENFYDTCCRMTGSCTCKMTDTPGHGTVLGSCGQCGDAFDGCCFESVCRHDLIDGGVMV